MNRNPPAIRTELAARLPHSRFLDPATLAIPDGHDVTRFEIGRAAVWVRPESTAEVRRIVEVARQTGTRVVPVGRRTAYWRPLDLDSAIAVDTGGLRGIAPPDVDSGSISCGAGVPLIELERHLAGHGFSLPLAPDAFGDTSVGSMVATACAAGLGMGRGDVDRWLLGLRVVLGTGGELVTGTSRALGAAPFARAGLPDPTALFVGAQGGLGIVTEVALRLARPGHRARLSLEAPGGPAAMTAAAALAEELRIDGLYDTFRTVRRLGPEGEGPATTDVDLYSPVSGEELAGRIELLRQAAGRHLPGARASVTPTPSGPAIPSRRFRQPPDGHPRSYESGQFAGLDLILPYGAPLAEALSLTDALLQEAAAIPHLDLRQALYAAPGYVNLGLHMTFEAAAGEPRAEVERLLARGAERLAPLPAVPYRWGTSWAGALEAKLAAPYREILREIGRIFDPDGLLRPRSALPAADSGDP